MTDTIQILLSAGQAGCIAIAAALWLCWRLVRVSTGAVLALLRRVWGRSRFAPVLWVGFWSVVLWGFSGSLSDTLQDVEVRYLNPVYVGQHSPDSTALVSIYEQEIQKHTTPAEFQAVKRWTESTARRIGSTPLAIYEAAYLECGLNPFRVRDDREAAGWIQFTRVGLQGLGVSLEQVIAACRARDVETIMRLTDAYLFRKAEKAPEGSSLANTIDLYLAVFAPAHIGRAPEAVVYAGFNNPDYFKNSGLDGWTVDGGKIVRGRKDGRITVREIWLCLERKKGLLFPRQ